MTTQKNNLTMAIMGNQKTNIAVSRQAKHALNAVREWSELPENKIIERIIEWFGSLENLGDDGIDVQGAIVGALPRSRTPEFACMILALMANGQKAGTPEDQLTPEQRKTLIESGVGKIVTLLVDRAEDGRGAQ